MIVWVASYPRSGNSLVMSTLWGLFGCRTSSVFDETRDIYDDKLYQMYGYEKLSYTRFAYWMFDKKAHFIKTHSTCMDSLPALYIVRDGRDVMCSFAHFNIAMRRTRLIFDNELHRCISNDGFSWSRRVLWWVRERTKFAQTVVIKFEDLLVHPALALCEALDDLKIDVDIHGSPKTFNELHKLEPRQFRSGQSGMWKTEMSETLQELFWVKHGEAMKELGYET